MASTATVKLLMDLEDRVSGQLQKIRSGLDNFQGKMEKMGPSFTKVRNVGIGAFAAITGEIVVATRAFGEAERSQRQLEHAVIAVSKGTKEQVKAISDLSDALQKKSGIDGDALKMGAAQLSTFGLQSKSVVDLTKSLADLTVNQNGVNASADQYVQSANTIAKALNGQFGVLEKSGIRFTEAQQSMILYGTEAEKVAALQEGLNQNLRETTDTLGGVDQASARLSRSFGEIQETIGAALAPALNDLMNKLIPYIDKIQEWIEKNPELTKTIVIVGLSIAALAIAVGTLGLALPAIVTGITAIGVAMGFLAANPIILLLAAFALIAATLKDQIAQLYGVEVTWKEVWTEIKSWFTGFYDWLTEKFLSMINFLERIADKIRSIKSAVGDAWGKVTGKKAMGGPVASSRTYLVGENGPELFTPSTYGSITPNHQLGGAGGVTIVMTGNTFVGKEGVAQMISKDLARELQMRMKLSY